MKVDLPEPEGPMMATSSPRTTRSVTLRRACTTTSRPRRYSLDKSAVSTTGRDSRPLIVLVMTSPAKTKDTAGPRARAPRCVVQDPGYHLLASLQAAHHDRVLAVAAARLDRLARRRSSTQHVDTGSATSGLTLCV